MTLLIFFFVFSICHPVVKDKEENIDLVDEVDTSLKELESLDVLADDGSGASS